jgi:hypothetical protein
MRRWQQNLGLAAGVTLLTLIGVEAGLRIVGGSKEHARELRSMLERSRAASPDPRVMKVSLRGLVQASSNDRIVYELKPGLRAIFIGAPVAINAAGFREREVPVAKPPGTFRIAGLGDSEMFGWGVPAEATYLRVLEDLLQGRGDPVRYEILNFAVPGYNAVMEVETFRSVARHYQPDLVLVGYVTNDDQLPNFMKRSALRWPSNLYVYNLLVHGVRAMRNSAHELMPARADYLGARMAAWGDVPEQYRDMEGPEAVRRAYAELAAMTRAMRVPVLVVGSYRGSLDPVLVAELEAQSRFAFVDTGDLYAAYQRDRGIQLRPYETVLSPVDQHSNVLGHRILGEGIYRAMVERRMVPPLASRPR